VRVEDTESQAEFRRETRAYLESIAGQAPSVDGDAGDVDERRAWQRKLAEGGLVGVTWPAEHGGRGLGPIEQLIVEQELERAELPGILDFIGVGMLGPAMIAHGSDAQKERYLGPLLHADEVWCQLFSEPAAGSDLAGIRTKATQPEGGGWTITGQKVWTTNAQFAAFGMLLARTDASEVKHKGLTMFIVPMDSAGIDVRPLRQINGEAHFNEIFLDGVKLPDDAVVGGVGNGWKVALTVLMFERLAISGHARGFGVGITPLIEAVKEAGATQDPVVRRRFADLAVDLLALSAASTETLLGLQSGIAPGPEAGLDKITLVEATTAAGELGADLFGPAALEPGSKWAEVAAFAPGLRSAGGSNEILANTIGERVLGLPPEPRADKGVPFEELPG
jgi:alkylation response protein AidB-like acyl-CoA dehydrogenase